MFLLSLITSTLAFPIQLHFPGTRLLRIDLTRRKEGKRSLTRLQRDNAKTYSTRMRHSGGKESSSAGQWRKRLFVQIVRQ